MSVASNKQYRFSIPNLPKHLWRKFQEIRKALDLTQRETLILALVVLCERGQANYEEVEVTARRVKDGAFEDQLGK